ncbi:sulfotransferase family protein [Motilibacter peucedani]|uniref:Sulfotransferase family protein n=1 Tax=Motilibacter peucedani TaxID=598650 RepID=A0A420XSR6_9ACTN|nr:sulfotransferase [Motilibacter peucedani]RKS77914.1 sulfotransferase family protein [Motilibacter peucedani]
MALPDFVIVGAPKCGTTALHVALDTHPQLFLSRNKEPKFFNADGSPPQQRGGPGDAATYAGYVWRRSDYEALFDEAPSGTLRGESTTLYLGDHEAHDRMAALVPHAKLVAVVRDPVDRAHSNWTHLRTAGLEPVPSFLDACAEEPRRKAEGWGLFWRYLELGLYGSHLEHLWSVFPREQVLVLVYRDLRERPAETLDRVTAFLGVETGVVTALPSANVTAQVSSSSVNRALAAAVRRASTAAPHLPGPLAGAAAAATGRLARLLQREQQRRTPLTPEERERLIPWFEDDIALFERLTGISVAHWRDPRNGTGREPLAVQRRFGTAFESIDRPTG